jgi:hypothetical protein
MKAAGRAIGGGGGAPPVEQAASASIDAETAKANGTRRLRM